MNSFIAWIGGKKLLRKEIVKRFPEEGFTRYVEVFGGAGWVLFEKEQGKEPEGKGRVHSGNEAYGDVMGEVRNEKKQLENKGTGTDSDGSLLAVRLFGSQRNIGNGSRDTGGDT